MRPSSCAGIYVNIFCPPQVPNWKIPAATVTHSFTWFPIGSVGTKWARGVFLTRSRWCWELTVLVACSRGRGHRLCIKVAFNDWLILKVNVFIWDETKNTFCVHRLLKNTYFFRFLEWRRREQAFRVSGRHYRRTVLLVFLLSAQYSGFDTEIWRQQCQKEPVLGNWKHALVWERHRWRCSRLEWCCSQAACSVFIEQALTLKV